MPRALMRGPHRRSIGSSRPTITGPRDAKDRIRWPSRRRPPSRALHGARLRTRWKSVKCRSRAWPVIRSTLATVRRPGARMAPTSSTWTCSQERWTKSGAKVMISAAKRAGRSGMVVSLGGNAVSLDPSRASSTLPDPQPIGQSRAESIRDKRASTCDARFWTSSVVAMDQGDRHHPNVDHCHGAAERRL